MYANYFGVSYSKYIENVMNDDDGFVMRHDVLLCVVFYFHTVKLSVMYIMSSYRYIIHVQGWYLNP